MNIRILNEMDKQEESGDSRGIPREELEAKLKEVQERLARYLEYQKLMEEPEYHSYLSRMQTKLMK